MHDWGLNTAGRNRWKWVWKSAWNVPPQHESRQWRDYHEMFWLCRSSHFSKPALDVTCVVSVSHNALHLSHQFHCQNSSTSALRPCILPGFLRTRHCCSCFAFLNVRKLKFLNADAEMKVFRSHVYSHDEQVLPPLVERTKDFRNNWKIFTLKVQNVIITIWFSAATHNHGQFVQTQMTWWGVWLQ